MERDILVQPRSYDAGVQRSARSRAAVTFFALVSGLLIGASVMPWVIGRLG
jgi:hypothetical protein